MKYSSVQMDMSMFSEPVIQALPKYSFNAFCTSDSCLSKAPKSSLSREEGAIKIVSKAAHFCPDCGYALFWTRKAI